MPKQNSTDTPPVTGETTLSPEPLDQKLPDDYPTIVPEGATVKRIPIGYQVDC